MIWWIGADANIDGGWLGQQSIEMRSGYLRGGRYTGYEAGVLCTE